MMRNYNTFCSIGYVSCFPRHSLVIVVMNHDKEVWWLPVSSWWLVPMYYLLGLRGTVAHHGCLRCTVPLQFAFYGRVCYDHITHLGGALKTCPGQSIVTPLPWAELWILRVHETLKNKRLGQNNLDFTSNQSNTNIGFVTTKVCWMKLGNTWFAVAYQEIRAAFFSRLRSFHLSSEIYSWRQTHFSLSLYGGRQANHEQCMSMA